MDDQSLYHKLFNACTDAIADMENQNFGQAKDRLIAAQQEAEERYLQGEEELELHQKNLRKFFLLFAQKSSILWIQEPFLNI